ncbi:hypothetical protein Acsp02_92980 [Actinoplanes sp. NBRC 103695]|nr:hypothetical protein Acsp02_92980 [Actinoplanes sp. NBRC 103695]
MQRFGSVTERLFRSSIVALILATVIWVCGAVIRWWTHPLIGWLPAVGLGVLATLACSTAARQVPQADGRRFWARAGLAAGLLTMAAVSNTFDSASRWPVTAQYISVRTMALYVAAVLVMQVALLCLPTSRRQGRVKLALDSSVVIVTVAMFAWHFSFRHGDQWHAVTGSWVAMAAVAVLGIVCIVAVVKVTTMQAIAVAPSAMRLLAVAAGGSGIAGAAAPLLVDHRHISDGHFAVPVALAFIGLAADQQRRTRDQPATAVRRRRWSVWPYLAVSAANSLLLIDGSGPHGRFLIASSVALTSLVVVRQIVALTDNGRLLDTVAAHAQELRQARDQMAEQASHDHLTGLPNRRLLYQLLDGTDGPSPAGLSRHLLLLDLDGFKNINDSLGHHVGDGLLCAVADPLRTTAGPDAVTARLGGDEFAIVVACPGDTGVELLVARVLDAFTVPLEVSGNELLISTSAGAALLEPAIDAAEAMRRADVALYAAKRDGGRKFVPYSQELDQRADEDARLGAQLRQALGRDELRLVYQPVVDMEDNRIVAVEALLRWHHHDIGMVSPALFVPLAERVGLIGVIGAWVLREACEQMVRWDRSPGDAPQRVSVNVSTRQLSDPALVATVAEIVRETGVEPSRIALEVTETAVFEGGVAVDNLQSLRDMGFLIALDDFGTGHSSLSLLRTCPADIVKIDKSFVDGVTVPGAHQVITVTLFQLTTGLGMSAIAEGVETVEQQRELQRAGYRFGQGFLFSRPVSADDVAVLMNRQPAATGV